ncbi:MarR family winged helix-turn-helix transcriptional regulator [Peptostreptococcus equinus]|uniref:MarR family transcriptional regulator n=1 Tax=Peptostreptococcus equinus TaxID=3003601 RepID=A0ABY7JM88_9FIRM|nr:MarR family transcriptional regulator [Peptostreptococcus sp. CBA3647]WAW14473.1 MarR family transcriptional regulator [Peptostreptococcus sp. CBA3647]
MRKSTGGLISVLYRKGSIYKNMCLKELDITASEQSFLCTLYENNGVSQDFLSKYLNIDKASTARVIKSLIDKKIVKKIKNENDKRENRIFLTDKAKDIREEIFSVLDSWSTVLTQGMSEQEKEQSYYYLQKMVENVEKYEYDKHSKKEREYDGK